MNRQQLIEERAKICHKKFTKIAKSYGYAYANLTWDDYCNEAEADVLWFEEHMKQEIAEIIQVVEDYGNPADFDGLTCAEFDKKYPDAPDDFEKLSDYLKRKYLGVSK